MYVLAPPEEGAPQQQSLPPPLATAASVDRNPCPVAPSHRGSGVLREWTREVEAAEEASGRVSGGGVRER